MTNDDVLGHTKETEGLIIIKINRKKNMKNYKSFLGGGGLGLFCYDGQTFIMHIKSIRDPSEWYVDF